MFGSTTQTPTHTHTAPSAVVENANGVITFEVDPSCANKPSNVSVSDEAASAAIPTVKAAESTHKPVTVTRAVATVVPRFNIDTEYPQALQYLNEQGYVVFASILTLQEVLKARELFKEWIGEVSNGLITSDPQTWTDENWASLNTTGLTFSHGIGQSNFLWFVRSIPKVRKFWELFYNTTELAVSFDGCGAFRGAEKKLTPQNPWPHADHDLNLLPHIMHTVQGIITLLDVKPDQTGSFICYPKSNKKYLQKYEQKEDQVSASMWHFVPIPAGHPLIQDQAIAPVMNAGDMVFWDSATIHANQQPNQDSIQNQLRRLVAYVCMVPASYVDPSERDEWRRERLAAVQNGITTGHVPYTIPKPHIFTLPQSSHLTHPESTKNRHVTEAERRLILGQ